MKTSINSNKAFVSGVGEWAEYSVNIQDGCENDCRYCYAKSMAIRFKRSTPKQWHESPKIRQHDIEKCYRKRKGRIMFPTSHDISPSNIDECVMVLRKILASGNQVLIVSKPNLSCIKRLCTALDEYKPQVMFRFTIGSADDATLRYWEPGAPSFQERLESLKLAYKKGFQTSVSCEPMLDNRIDRVIQAVKPYVTDAIWLGRANRLRPILAVNCPNDAEVMAKADKLLSEQTDDYLRGLYERFKTDPQIKFKDSIKKAVGLERPVEAGLDV